MKTIKIGQEVAQKKVQDHLNVRSMTFGDLLKRLKKVYSGFHAYTKKIDNPITWHIVTDRGASKTKMLYTVECKDGLATYLTKSQVADILIFFNVNLKVSNIPMEQIARQFALRWGKSNL